MQSAPSLQLPLTVLYPDIPCFKNNVDPNQLTSEKPDDQDAHFFHCINLLPASTMKLQFFNP